MQTSSNIRGYASRLMQIVKGVNPVQEFANSISAQLGFIKRELILRNPQNIKLRQKTVFGVEGIAPPTTEVVWSFTRGGQNAGVLPIAVLLHAHHPEVISEILNAVDNVSEQFHLIVTSSRDDAFDEVLKNLPLNANRVTLVRCENIGRDVKPFLEVLKLGLIDGSEAVLKIHTKRTIGMSYGDGWRSALLQQLIPEANLLKQVISSIRSGKFGLVGPRNDYLTDGDKYWGNNAQNVSRIRKTLEIQLPDSQLRFFAGTMFWFSPRALSGVTRLLEEFVFDQELGQMDGTIAHAIERSVIDIAEHNGFRIGTVSVRLDDLPADGNDEQWFPGSIEL